jgi:phage host-nuclease inhibitor protein Gam
MQAYKQNEETKRENLNKYIQEQRKLIQEKEALIKSKNDKISKMEEEYDEKLRELRQQYQAELDRKKELDKEL